MKRFAYVCADPGIPIPGQKGASIHVESVCKSLLGAGLDGEIFTTRAKSPALAGIPVRALATLERKINETPAQREARMFLSAHFGEIAPDADCDFIYERYSLWHTGGLVRARELGVPFILEVNSPLPEEARRYRSLSHVDLAEGLGRLLLTEADGLVCVSDQIAEWVIERRGCEDGVWVVPNGVAPELFSPEGPQARIPWDDHQGPLIAFSGAFRPWHGIDDMLQAFRQLSSEVESIRLLCVGDGPLLASFTRDVEDAGLADHVHFTGAVPHLEVPRWLRNADVAIVPYPQLSEFYFSPLKLYEFMSLGLPIVAADVGQITETLGSNQRGLLYRPGKPEELVDAILRLLAHPVEAGRMASQARRWVLENATWDCRVDSILSGIDGLCHTEPKLAKTR